MVLHWISVDLSISSWMKWWWVLVLEMLATFWRQRGNGAKSHLRAGRHKCQLYFTYIFMCTFLSCVISLIVLLTLPSLSSVAAAVLPVKHSNDQNKASLFNLWPVVGRKIWRTWQLISCWDQNKASPFNLWPVVSSTVWRTWQLTHYWNQTYDSPNMISLFCLWKVGRI